MTENIFYKPAALKDTVHYQTGSIVSRTVIDKPVGTITIFAFDKGQALSEHTAPFDAFVYTIEGQAEVSIVGEIMTLAEGEMIILPAGKVHAVKALTQFKMALVMIRE